MRLAISGYFGCGNAGDEAILAGMLRTFRAEEPDLDITVLSGAPLETQRAHGVRSVSRTQPITVARAIRSADGLISGGGGLLQDVTSARPVAYYVGVMGLARGFGRPYVIHAQGLGPIRRQVNRALAAWALRGAAHVSLRDEPSIALARQLGATGTLSLVPDPALAWSPVASGPTGHLLVAVRGGAGAHLTSLREALVQLGRRRRIVALPMHGHEDLAACREAVAGVPGAEVVSPDAQLPEQLEAIASSALVIGMRLHALVLAAAAGIPALAISYDPKVEAFSELAGMIVVGRADAAMDADRLVAAVETALSADMGAYHQRVDAMRRGLPRAAAESLAAIREAVG